MYLKRSQLMFILCLNPACLFGLRYCTSRAAGGDVGGGLAAGPGDGGRAAQGARIGAGEARR